MSPGDIAQLIAPAIATGQVLAVTYRHKDGSITTHQVVPYSVEAGARSKTNKPMFWSYCLNHGRMSKGFRKALSPSRPPKAPLTRRECRSGRTTSDGVQERPGRRCTLSPGGKPMQTATIRELRGNLKKYVEADKPTLLIGRHSYTRTTRAILIPIPEPERANTGHPPHRHRAGKAQLRRSHQSGQGLNPRQSHPARAAGERVHETPGAGVSPQEIKKETPPPQGRAESIGGMVSSIRRKDSGEKSGELAGQEHAQGEEIKKDRGGQLDDTDDARSPRPFKKSLRAETSAWKSRAHGPAHLRARSNVMHVIIRLPATSAPTKSMLSRRLPGNVAARAPARRTRKRSDNGHYVLGRAPVAGRCPQHAGRRGQPSRGGELR